MVIPQWTDTFTTPSFSCGIPFICSFPELPSTSFSVPVITHSSPPPTTSTSGIKYTSTQQAPSSTESPISTPTISITQSIPPDEGPSSSTELGTSTIDASTEPSMATPIPSNADNSASATQESPTGASASLSEGQPNAGALSIQNIQPPSSSGYSSSLFTTFPVAVLSTSEETFKITKVITGVDTTYTTVQLSSSAIVLSSTSYMTGAATGAPSDGGSTETLSSSPSKTPLILGGVFGALAILLLLLLGFVFYRRYSRRRRLHYPQGGDIQEWLKRRLSTPAFASPTASLLSNDAATMTVTDFYTAASHMSEGDGTVYGAVRQSVMMASPRLVVFPPTSPSASSLIHDTDPFMDTIIVTQERPLSEKSVNSTLSHRSSPNPFGDHTSPSRGQGVKTVEHNSIGGLSDTSGLAEESEVN